MSDKINNTNIEEEEFDFDDEARWSMLEAEVKNDSTKSLKMDEKEQYEENNRLLAKAKRNGARTEELEYLNTLNNSLHKNVHKVLEKGIRPDPDGEKNDSMAKNIATNRITIMKSIGESLKRANERFKIVGLTAYNAITAPVNGISAIAFKSDVRDYQREIDRLQKKLDSKKERISSKARTRLSKLNIRNMKRGRNRYTEIQLKPREQKIIDRLEIKINSLKHERDKAQANYDNILKARNGRTERIKEYKADLAKHHEEKQAAKELKRGTLSQMDACDLNSSQSGIDIDGDGQIDFNVITSHDDERIADVRDCEPTALFKNSLDENIKKAGEKVESTRSEKVTKHSERTEVEIEDMERVRV